MKEEDEFHISALALPNKMFNIQKKTGNNQLEHLKDIKIHNVGASDIGILIGANAPEAFIQPEVRKELPIESYKIKIALGGSLLGNISKNETNNSSSQFSINHLDFIAKDEMLHQLVKNLRKIEDYFSTNSREVTLSREYKQCLNSLTEETKLV